MKPELRRLVEEHFGIPHPETKKPVKNPQLNPQDAQQAAQLRINQEYDALPEREKQEIQWQRRNIDPKLKVKAEKIIQRLNGDEISPLLLSEKYDIFENYFHVALAKLGYIAKTQIGSPSIGLTWIYIRPEPILCPHCKKEIPRNLLKDN